LDILTHQQANWKRRIKKRICQKNKIKNRKVKTFLSIPTVKIAKATKDPIKKLKYPVFFILRNFSINLFYS
jgi:hypothetical protein